MRTPFLCKSFAGEARYTGAGKSRAPTYWDG